MYFDDTVGSTCTVHLYQVVCCILMYTVTFEELDIQCPVSVLHPNKIEKKK